MKTSLRAFIQAASFYEQVRPVKAHFFDSTCVKVAPGSHPCGACGNRSLAFLYPVLADGVGEAIYIGENCLDAIRQAGKLRRGCKAR